MAHLQLQHAFLNGVYGHVAPHMHGAHLAQPVDAVLTSSSSSSSGIAAAAAAASKTDALLTCLEAANPNTPGTPQDVHSGNA
jgi:hypothetical protein